MSKRAWMPLYVDESVIDVLASAADFIFRKFEKAGFGVRVYGTDCAATQERLKSARQMIEGPTVIYGYDNKIHFDNATPSDWRQFWLAKARSMGTHTKSEWTDICRHHNWACAYCYVDNVVLTQDHIIPISKYGCDCAGNIQPLCKSCNSSKGNRI